MYGISKTPESLDDERVLRYMPAEEVLAERIGQFAYGTIDHTLTFDQTTLICLVLDTDSEMEVGRAVLDGDGRVEMTIWTIAPSSRDSYQLCERDPVAKLPCS